MVNEFYEDKEREHEEFVKKVIHDSEPHQSEGAGTIRYFWGNYVVKVAAHENGVFTQEAVEDNVRLLLDRGIHFPESTFGKYDLSGHPHFWRGTPVLIQEEAFTFKDSLDDNDSPTERTYSMLKKAIDLVDMAVANKLTIDDSLSNFGLLGNTMTLMDIQDENSVKKGVKGEFRKMYSALITSLVKYGMKREKAEEIVSRQSRFY